jgi:hypothetical protein
VHHCSPPSKTLWCPWGTWTCGRGAGRPGHVSPSACFTSWLARCEQLVEPVVGITGLLDLRGRVLGVGGTPEKAKAARRVKLERLVTPESNLTHLRADRFEALTSLEPTLGEWGSAAVVGASSTVDVVATTVPGGYRRVYCRSGPPLNPRNPFPQASTEMRLRRRRWIRPS